MKPEFLIERQGGLCECGCGNPAPIAKRTDRKFGWERDRPKRFLLGHATRRNIPDYIVADRGYKTPCWIWNRGLSPGGYGQSGRGANAHRRYYERYRGPIPAGLELDHLCRVRACVNPDHLEPVTHSVNAKRGLTGKQPKPRALDERGERAVAASPLSNRSLARLYGCSHESIRQARIRAGSAAS